MLDPDERGECIAHITESVKTKSPGPAAYKIKRSMKKDVPPIKMKGRHSLQQDINKAPYYNVGSSFGKTTPIKMHGRTPMKEREVTPGPSYVPPPFGSTSRKVGFASHSVSYPRPKTTGGGRGDDGGTRLGKRRNKDATPGPGPGAYSTRCKDFDEEGKKGIAISGSHNFSFGSGASPGPAAYKPKYDKILPAAPKYGFHDRPKTSQPESTPGYRNLGSTLGGPRYSMKARANDDICII